MAAEREPVVWGEDEFYDLIEVLHDFASWPGEWRHHDYGGCVGRCVHYAEDRIMWSDCRKAA